MSYYLQITTRCNMSCIHCCFDCSNIGIDIDTNFAIKVLEYLKSTNYYRITIGGGEPTLHPDFLYIVGYALKNEFQVGIITNGTSNNDIFRRLKYYKRNFGRNLSISVSNDLFHNRSMINKWWLGYMNPISNCYYLSLIGRALHNKEKIKLICKYHNKEIYFHEPINIDNMSAIYADATIKNIIGLEKYIIGDR